MSFTHLHVHSHYSILDGMSKVPDLVNRSIELGMRSIALTDHGNMFGIKEFLDYCAKLNGKPKGKVKECEEEIAKAKALVSQIPDIQEKLEAAKSADDKNEIESLETKLKDAKAAESKLPGLEAQLPELQQKAADYVPFKPIVGVEAYCARRSHKLKDKNIKELNGKPLVAYSIEAAKVYSRENPIKYSFPSITALSSKRISSCLPINCFLYSSVVSLPIEISLALLSFLTALVS